MLAARGARALKGTVSPKPSYRGNFCGPPTRRLVRCFSAGGTPLGPVQIPRIACWVGAGREQEEWLSLRGAGGRGLGALHHEEPLQGPTQTSASPWMLVFLQPEQLPAHWTGSGLGEGPPGLVSLCPPWGPPRDGRALLAGGHRPWSLPSLFGS